MGWKTINGHRYYYRSVREGGRVRTEYCGSGLGALAEMLDREDREEREIHRQADRDACEEVEAIEKVLDQLAAEAKRQAEAVLVSHGYHKHHRGEWRKRRDRPKNCQNQ